MTITRLGSFVRSRVFSWPRGVRMALDLALLRGGARAPDSGVRLTAWARAGHR